MNMQTLRDKLKGVNLTKLAQASGVHVRSLHRIKSGEVDTVKLATMEAILDAIKRKRA